MTAPTGPAPSVAVVVGNPKPRSRTRLVAEAVAGAVLDARGHGGRGVEPAVVDLADLAPELFDWSSPAVAAAVEVVEAASLVVVASPTYKATYTGLLKAFLDRFSTTSLSGAVVVPVMVGAGPVHALAMEVHLRPLLVELGAATPTRGLYVLEGDVDRLDEAIATWLGGAAPNLGVAVA